jgi:two-component system chemotaxis sensor kinase CheA
MNKTTSNGANAAAGIDLGQFHPVFFEEASENLARMEQLLLDVDIASADDETLNAIFRCAHSVKGGAATFGFADVAELTHQMETLLDRLRRHELAATAAMVDVLLLAGDALKAQLARHQGIAADAVESSVLELELRRLAGLDAGVRPAPPAVTPPLAPAPGAPTATVPRRLELRIGPLPEPSAIDGLLQMFAEIPALGHIEALAADTGANDNGLRRFELATTSSDDELRDLFSFHVDGGLIQMVPLVPQAVAPPAAPAATANATPSAAESSTLRVSVDKVDQLVNLVGELVITQAMLRQHAAALDPASQHQLGVGFADLERHTRELQDAVMSIRMVPMSAVFSRFPRMLRDLASKLGKQIELVTHGGATELDKGMIEKITDPLTHLVRNSCDHGIEGPEERLARGKPAAGTITLAASHQGGSVIIEVRDDGKGLSRATLLAKARERGLHAPDSLSDTQAWGLIFAPGFSTAAVVTDVSGRGVGLDVVKRNIAALGGVVEIDSSEGHGMGVRVRLPLTLAIMDSMSVRVGDECYILPLASVVESFQFAPAQLRSIGGQARVIQVRDEFLPVFELERVFDVQRSGCAGAASMMVVVEAEGARIALQVNELLGQQQVVVKNLESNFGRVDNISGATIMGDGRVALILDVGALVRRSRH